MKVPDKIYVQPNAHDGWFEGDKPNDNFVEYIHKDALLEWAKELKERWAEPPVSIHSPGCVYMLEQVIDRLNSM